VVFTNPPVTLSQKGYWQARVQFRGYIDGRLAYFTIHFRSTFTTATRYWFDASNIEQDVGIGGRLEPGDIWRDLKVSYPTDSGRTHRTQIDFYTGISRFSGGVAEFHVGRFRPIIDDDDGDYLNDGSFAYSGENDHLIRSMPIRDSGHGDQASR
jgi:hypothetical protein